MPRTALDTLIARVSAYFKAQAGHLGLNPETIQVRYILNWGGFVNASFFIQDGQKTYHLKLADDEESKFRLERWRRFHKRLSEQYRAPRMKGWVKIPHTVFAGPLFEYIPGKQADYIARPEVLRGVLDLLARLHADHALAKALEAEQVGEEEDEWSGDQRTCTDTLLAVYIERLDNDLIIIANDLPPFVSLDLLTWMMGETRELEGLARDLPAFALPAQSPIHSDLWASNVLVTADGAWYVIDWDDLTLGDPALDYSVLLGPIWRQGALSLEEIANLLPAGDAALRERFMLYLRALLLDEVIDTLADWVEASFAPEHMEEVRAAKEATHHAALARYREFYCAG